MSESRQPDLKVWYLLSGLVLIFILIRFPLFNVIMLRVLLIGGIALCLYLLYAGIRLLRRELRQRSFRRSPEGKIQSRLDDCRRMMDKNQQEMEEIQQQMADLKSKVQSAGELSAQHYRETGELLSAFEAELKLRSAKAAFFHSCLRKLESMLSHYQLSREIEEKKQRLQQLRENHFEELARLEEMKTDLEMDSHFLDTIEELSFKMVRSHSIDDAEHLRLELEEMTRELDEL